MEINLEQRSPRMITMRHRSLKQRKLQLKVEAVENPECFGEISAKTGQEILETRLAHYLKEAMKEAISQCKERMVRLIQLKDKEIGELKISKESLLLECRRVQEERKTEETILVQKGEEIKEENRRLVVQTKKKLRRKREQIRELRKKLITLEREKTKMEIEKEELSKVNMKLLSENKNLKEKFSLMRKEKNKFVELKEKVTELEKDAEKVRSR